MDLMYLHWLQDWRIATGGAFDDFFVKTTHLGEGTAGMITMASIYWSLNRDLGRKLLLAMVIMIFLVVGLKMLIAVPRPFVLDSTLTPLHYASGYSFPSGHSGRAAALWGALGIYFFGGFRESHKKKYLLGGVLMMLLTFLIMLSRNYIGVHTPQDVLTGFGIGIASYGASCYLLNRAKENIDILSTLRNVMLLAAILLIVYTYTVEYPDMNILSALSEKVTNNTRDSWSALGAVIGTCLGLHLSKADINRRLYLAKWQVVLSLAVGLAVLYALSSVVYPMIAVTLGKAFGGFCTGLITLLYVLAVYPWLMKKCGM